MAALIVSVLDRGIINLLVEPIMQHYQLSDTQFGALQSVAFGAFYVVMAIPLGIVADRWQRRIVVGAGVTIFSVCALMTGLSKTFTQLFVSRMGVGFGEASVTPAGYSMLADCFPPHRLGRAASLLSMANFIGASMAMVVGGYLIGSFDALAATSPQALFGLAPWQATIACIALPGLLVAPCLFLLPEPRRRGGASTLNRLPAREVLRELGKRKRVLFLLIGGMSMASMMANGVAIWTPALFIRAYGWSTSDVGLWLGLSIFTGAVIGSFLAGWTSDWMTQRNRLDAPIKVAAISFAGAGVFGVVAPLMPTGELALGLLLPVLFLQPMAFACAPMALQLIVPNRLRAQTTAIYMTMLNLLGLAMGPLVIGFMTDRMFSEPSDVRYSIALLTAVTAPLMVLLMALAISPFRALRQAPA